MSRRTDSLPYSEIAEYGVLGSFIHCPDKVYEKCLFRGVASTWFHHPDHGKVFDALCFMHKEGMFLDHAKQHAEQIDYLQPVTQYLIDNASRIGLSTSNVQATLSDFYMFVPGATNIDHYIDILQEKSVLRSAVVESLNLQETLKKCLSIQEVTDALTGAFTATKSLCAVQEKKNWKKEEMMAFIDEMEALCTKSKEPDVMPFFLPSLDAHVGGIMKGEMCIIQGMTSSGKSLASGMIIARNAIEHNRKSAVFTFEMLTREYLKRTTALLGKISLASMRNGKFSQYEFNTFMSTHQRIQDAPIDFYDIKRCRPTPATIEASIRRHSKNHGLELVAIDHLNLIQFPGSKLSRRDQDLTEFANNLKLLAQELDFAIILLAQSNKEGSVFDSQQVESACDYSLALTPTYETVNGVRKITGTDGLWVSKMRSGPRGWKLPLVMEGEFSSIYEPTEPVIKQQPAKSIFRR